ncbi:unnamed protein product [Nezara viridula]|uniref:Uncharacterized protein n=1 Tax=Nezara viridula TaxID=85310 RepID=A0A9P0HMJ7_NEZVI|nr:unnamed protein product [Nezara viridula]CAH1404998.1 unnamed protein product [Nezara viridula]
MIPRESRTIFSANLATSLMSTPSSSRKLLVLFGIVPRDPNQRPLTVNSLSPKVSRNFSFRKGIHLSYVFFFSLSTSPA